MGWGTLLKRGEEIPADIARLNRSLFVDQAGAYRRHSQTQYSQGHLLLDKTRVDPGSFILDVGCGDGGFTRSISEYFPGCTIDAIDVSPDMVRAAQSAHGSSRVRFAMVDLLQFEPERLYDTVISNSAMHWILPPEEAYRRLRKSLRIGGLLAVHQGGRGCYRGLRQATHEVIRDLGWTGYFRSWVYPAHYPSALELQDLLWRAGFAGVEVLTYESDGAEFPSLCQDWAHSGLLPYLMRLPEHMREVLRTRFLERTRRRGADGYTYRLFAWAQRPPRS